MVRRTFGGCIWEVQTFFGHSQTSGTSIERTFIIRCTSDGRQRMVHCTCAGVITSYVQWLHHIDVLPEYCGRLLQESKNESLRFAGQPMNVSVGFECLYSKRFLHVNIFQGYPQYQQCDLVSSKNIDDLTLLFSIKFSGSVLSGIFWPFLNPNSGNVHLIYKPFFLLSLMISPFSFMITD